MPGMNFFSERHPRCFRRDEMSANVWVRRRYFQRLGIIMKVYAKGKITEDEAKKAVAKEAQKLDTAVRHNYWFIF
jgi:hypothetical protein